MQGAEDTFDRDQIIALAVARLIATARAGGHVEIIATQSAMTGPTRPSN